MANYRLEASRYKRECYEHRKTIEELKEKLRGQDSSSKNKPERVEPAANSAGAELDLDFFGAGAAAADEGRAARRDRDR